MKLLAKKRNIKGKQVSALRSSLIVPASVFGPKREPENLEVDEKALYAIFKEAGYNRFFDLEIEGAEKSKVLIKELQRNPVTDKILSVAFYQIAEDRKITVEVPIRFIGESLAVKQNLGFLIAQYDTIKLNCLPKDLPSELVVDLAPLEKPTDTILVSSITLPAEVTLDSSVDPESAVAYIGTAQKEEALEAKATEAATAAAEAAPAGTDEAAAEKKE